MAAPSRRCRLQTHRQVSVLLAMLLSASCSYAGAEGRLGSRVLSGGRHLTTAPASFPVPVYAQNVLHTEFTQVPYPGNNSGSITAVTQTGDVPSMPFEWYENWLHSSGWMVVLPKNEGLSAAQTNGNLLMLKASKDNLNLLIICSKMQRCPYTTVSVSAMQSNPPNFK